MHAVERLVRILFVLSLIAFSISFFFRKTLPDINPIGENLISDPIQEQVETKPITIQQDGMTAELIPLYNYSTAGLVVTDHRSGVWYDYAHKNDPFNTRDLCLVWGQNLTSGSYNKGSYKSGDFTCYWDFKTWDDYNSFSSLHIANNHLIPANSEIENKINSVAVGDVVQITGQLVNYQVSDETSTTYGSRTTSTTRSDTGNGACEVIYVTAMDILDSPRHYWQLIYHYSKYTTIFTLVIVILMVILLPLHGFRKKKEA
ncbi:hypothetical protein ACFL04_04330 [Patescibacteria group bacterium]